MSADNRVYSQYGANADPKSIGLKAQWMMSGPQLPEDLPPGVAEVLARKSVETVILIRKNPDGSHAASVHQRLDVLPSTTEAGDDGE